MAVVHAYRVGGHFALSGAAAFLICAPYIVTYFAGFSLACREANRLYYSAMTAELAAAEDIPPGGMGSPTRGAIANGNHSSRNLGTPRPSERSLGGSRGDLTARSARTPRSAASGAGHAPGARSTAATPRRTGQQPAPGKPQGWWESLIAYAVLGPAVLLLLDFHVAVRYSTVRPGVAVEAALRAQRQQQQQAGQHVEAPGGFMPFIGARHLEHYELLRMLVGAGLQSVWQIVLQSATLNDVVGTTGATAGVNSTLVNSTDTGLGAIFDGNIVPRSLIAGSIAASCLSIIMSVALLAITARNRHVGLWRLVVSLVRDLFKGIEPVRHFFRIRDGRVGADGAVAFDVGDVSSVDDLGAVAAALAAARRSGRSAVKSLSFKGVALSRTAASVFARGASTDPVLNRLAFLGCTALHPDSVDDLGTPNIKTLALSARPTAWAGGGEHDARPWFASLFRTHPTLLAVEWACDGRAWDLTGHQESVTCITAMDGAKATMVATGSYDGSIRVWDVATRAWEWDQATDLFEQGDVEANPAIPNNGIFTGKTPRPDLQPGAHQRKAPLAPTGPGSPTSGADASRKAATGAGEWHPPGGHTIARLAPASVRGRHTPVHAITSLGQGRLAAGYGDGGVLIWLVRSTVDDPGMPSRLLRQCSHGHKEGVYCIAGLSIPASMWRKRTEAGGARRGRGSPGRFNSSSVEITGGGTDVDYCVSGSDDTTLKVWDVATGACLDTLVGHSLKVHCVAALGDGIIASGSGDNTIRIWVPSPSTSSAAAAAAAAADAAAAAVDPMARHRSRVGRRPREAAGPHVGPKWTCALVLQPPAAKAVLSMATLRDGRLATGGADNLIRVWRVHEGLRRKLDAHGGNPGPRTLEGAGGRGGGAHPPASDSEEGDSIISDSGSYSGDERKGYSDDDRRGRARSRPARMDVSDGVSYTTLEGHNDWVHALSVAPDGRLVSAGDDRQIKFWNTDTRRRVHRCVWTSTSWDGAPVMTMVALADGRVASNGIQRSAKLFGPFSGHFRFTRADVLGGARSLTGGSGRVAVSYRDDPPASRRHSRSRSRSRSPPPRRDGSRDGPKRSPAPSRSPPRRRGRDDDRDWDRDRRGRGYDEGPSRDRGRAR